MVHWGKGNGMHTSLPLQHASDTGGEDICNLCTFYYAPMGHPKAPTWGEGSLQVIEAPFFRTRVENNSKNQPFCKLFLFVRHLFYYKEKKQDHC